MEKISIVILNYLNYQDTLECVTSIFQMGYEIAGIVIVDNNSNNESVKKLKKQYNNKKNIIILKAKKNYGYAKGNNIGIEVARKRFHTDFVFVVNNDVVFFQKDFFIKLMDNYHKGIGVIGPTICIHDEIIQGQFSTYVSLKECIWLYIWWFLKKKNKLLWSHVLSGLDIKKQVSVLHGSAILFTPDFFQYYKGFYSRTFLYNEEAILYMMCEKHGLKQKYVKDAFIFHKEDQSSELSFGNDSKIMTSYQLDSYKYVVWWSLKNKIFNII
ncbi:MAG: glycosyltransferase [Lachnospiraceae bacterium]